MVPRFQYRHRGRQRPCGYILLTAVRTTLCMRLQVFVTARPSIPDLPWPPGTYDEAVAPGGLLAFDSLKSLPTSLPGARAAGPGPAAGPTAPPAPGPSGAPPPPASVPVPAAAHVEAMAAHLRSQFGLTLFGFDIVVAVAAVEEEDLANGTGAAGSGGSGGGDGAGDCVVIDVNYFPHYRGAPGASPGAFLRTALKGAYAAFAGRAGAAALVGEAATGPTGGGAGA